MLLSTKHWHLLADSGQCLSGPRHDASAFLEETSWKRPTTEQTAPRAAVRREAI